MKNIMPKLASILAGIAISGLYLQAKELTEAPKIAETVQLVVDPVNGKKENSGESAAKALLTLEQARDTIRAKKLNQNMKADLIVQLRGGRYQLNETLKFGPEDSGTNGFSVIYKNSEGENPILCGGRRITGWKQVAGKPYYEAKAPESDGFTNWFWQLYVNGVRAERARSNVVLTKLRKNGEGPKKAGSGMSRPNVLPIRYVLIS